MFLSATDPFTFGFERVLDGIDAYLAAHQRGRSPAAVEPEWVVLADADVAGDKRYREAHKAVREAEKALRDARKLERIAARDARERLRGIRAADRPSSQQSHGFTRVAPTP